jgi:ketosteroid isomerase-like protein
MSNEDAVELLSTLDPVSTPVLIAPQLQWVTPSQAQSFHEGFRSAHAAWQAAMRQGDLQAVRSWYDPKAASVDWAEVGPPGEPSILGWYGDGQHVVVVTARHRGTDGDRASLVRQYWVKGDGGWRIFFDGLVPQRSDAAARQRQRRSGSTAQAPRS